MTMTAEQARAEANRIQNLPHDLQIKARHTAPAEVLALLPTSAEDRNRARQARA